MRALAWFGVLLVSTTAWAGGFGGSDAPTRIPVPAREFRASAHDRAGGKVDLTRVTWGGEVFVFGEHAGGQMAVPFEKIAEVRVERGADADHVAVTVSARDGTSVRLTADADTLVYGATSYGANFQIELEDLGKLVLIP